MTRRSALRPLSALLVFTLAAAFLGPAPVAGQQHEMRLPGVTPDSAIPLLDNLGMHARRITTRSAGAQAYFDQGIRLGYAFAAPEAQRSFAAALRQDSLCAACEWGLAWTLGPNINARMDSVAGARAWEHAQAAKRLGAGLGGAERALIDAMAARYERVPREGTERTRRAPLDSAYMLAMRDVVRRFPDDLDAATLYAESIMLLRPLDYWTRAGQPRPGVGDLLGVLEAVLARAPSHPGACHLYIHATEASPGAGRAAGCADRLVDAMPGASHMQHMPSHTYVRIGRYGDAVRVNQAALVADREAKQGGATSTYPEHNLHMLLVAASYDGQSAVAIKAARDLAELDPAWSYLLPLVLARFGRWEEILQLSPPRLSFPFAVTAYARGIAQVRTGRLPDTDRSRSLVDAEYKDNPSFAAHTMMGIARTVLAAEVDAANGRYDAAIRSLQQARALEADSLPTVEPENWVVPVRQVLGAVLLQAGRAADAEAAYRGELESHPENGWALYGLSQALDAQGKKEEAQATLERFRRAWTRADVEIRSSRF